MRQHRKDFLLLFHDTHHRLVSLPHQIVRFNLGCYDGILAFGKSPARMCRTRLGFENVEVFHEAADTRTFFPREAEKDYDMVWVGNWGENERSEEIRDYLIETATDTPTIRRRHHCDLRAEQLEDICRTLRAKRG